MKKIDGACHSTTGGWLSHCVSRTRPTRASARLTRYHSLLLKKILSPFSHFTKIQMQHFINFNQAESVRFWVCSRSSAASGRVRRVLTVRSGALDWSERGSQRAVEVPPCPRRDVGYRPRWWKLAASRPRVVGCRSRGLGCTCPLYRACWYTWQV